MAESVQRERPLLGRVAVIGGGAGAIGRATASRLAGAGCRLALLDLDAAAVQAVVSALDLGDAHLHGEEALFAESRPKILHNEHLQLRSHISFSHDHPLECPGTFLDDLRKRLWIGFHSEDLFENHCPIED